MKYIQTLLLGSAAGLSTISLAQAADLPATKSAPVEYVRVCSAHGPGFFYIPGTDTCIKIGGRARFEYQYTGVYLNGASNDRSAYRGQGRLDLDARTATDWGTLRTFVRFDIASRTGGGPLRSGTAERTAAAFFGTGVDTYGRAQKYTEIDKAFIQFGGLTAGRISSFYDFYAHDFEILAYSPVSDIQSTNGIAYTLKLGSGLSATLSVEDPTFRRSPLYYTNSGYANQVPGSYLSTSLTNLPYTGSVFQAPVGLTFDPTTGLATSYARVDVAQRNQVPDVIAALRLEQGWGSAQISGVVHQISIGQYVSTTTPGATVTSSGSISAATSGIYAGSASTSAYASSNGLLAKRPDATYGYAIQGGVKLKLDQIAPGDQFVLQGAWGRGALAYTGLTALLGGDTATGLNYGRFAVNTLDGYIDSTGDIKLSESWAVTAAFLHYWTPTIRQSFVAGYGAIDYGNGARSVNGPLYAGLGGSLIPVNGAFTTQQAVNYAASSALKDWSYLYVASGVTWSPVKNLDIGAELAYTRLDISGRVTDLNKNVAYTVAGVSYPKTTSNQDLWMGRIRVQRDF